MELPHIVSQEGRGDWGLISSPYSVQCSGKLGPQVQWSNVSVCFTVALGLPSNMILQQRVIQFSRLSFLIIMVHRRKEEEKDWSYNLSWFRYKMTFQFSATKYYYYYLTLKENNKTFLWYRLGTISSLGQILRAVVVELFTWLLRLLQEYIHLTVILL